MQEHLLTLKEGGAPILSTVLPALTEVLGTQKAIAYGLKVGQKSLAVDFVHSNGAPAQRIREEYDRLLGAGVFWGAYNPIRPDPRQRNISKRLRDLPGAAESAFYREAFPRFGVKGHDQLRVLICEGPALMAFIGLFQPVDFSSRQSLMLSALVPQLRRRLNLERQLCSGRLALAALEQSLEALGRSAFVVKGPGEVLHANALGKAQLEADRMRVTELLSQAVAGQGGAFEPTRLLIPGTAAHFLLVARPPARDPAPRAAAAAARWGLTPRQAEVLRQVALGESNQTIAVKLECSERTIEVHVSAVLDRSQTQSRSALVAKFWTEF